MSIFTERCKGWKQKKNIGCLAGYNDTMSERLKGRYEYKGVKIYDTSKSTRRFDREKKTWEGKIGDITENDY